MDFGSIGKMFEPPFGDLVKGIIAGLVFAPFVASFDFGFQPPQ